MTLKREAKIVRLTFGDGWIDVRSERAYRDTVKAQRAAASRVPVGSDETNRASRRRGAATTQLDFDLSAFNLSLLTTMIVAWSDEDIPINEDSVQDLPDEIIQEVLTTILGGMTEEEKAPLEKNSTSVSEPPEESGQLEEKAPAGLPA